MWCPRTKTHTVAGFLGNQNRSLEAHDDGGMLPDLNGDELTPIGTKNPNRLERGAQEPRLFSAGGTGGQYGAGRRKGERKRQRRGNMETATEEKQQVCRKIRMVEADMQDGGHGRR